MARTRLANSVKVTLHIDCLPVQTTMGALRNGRSADCIQRLLTDFEAARAEYAANGKPPIIGYTSGYPDFEGKHRNLQIDID